MPQFIFEQFDSQSSAVPANPAKNPFYQLFGVYPDYAKKTGSVQEEQAAPMAAAPRFIVLQSGLNGNIKFMIHSTYPGYSAFAITDTSNVYSFDSYYYLGTPTAFFNNAGVRLEVFNGNLLASEYSKVAYMNLSTRASWNLISGATTTGIALLKSFLTSCFVTNISSGSLEINQINPDWSVTSNVLTLGNGWYPMELENWNNKLLAIAASQSTVTGGVSSNFGSSYIFLWDGFSTFHNYTTKVPGLFIDFCSPDNNLYVLHQTGLNNFTVSAMSTGMALKQIANFSYNITSATKIMPFNTDKLAVMTSLGVLIVDPSDGSSYFLDNLIKDNSYTYITGASGGLNNYLYAAAETSGGSISTVNYFPFLVGSYGYQDILFNTQYLTAQTPSGQATVDNVEVWYDTAPAGSGDTINLTLDADFSSDPNAAAGAKANYSVALPQINSSNSNAKYTVLDGQGTQFNKLKLSGFTYSASGWFPIIRKIIVNYQ